MDLALFEQERLALLARHGFQGASHWVADREGRRTYLIARGDGPCPTVLIHGGMSEASEWSLLAGRLPGHIMILDRPGCGLSYSIDYGRVDNFRHAAAAWLSELIDAFGCDQVNLVGNSMGGYFAMAFAMAHPERVRRLVQVGAPPGFDRKTVPLFIRLLGNPIVGPVLGKMTTTNPETFRKRVLSNLVAHPEAVPTELITIMMAAETIPGASRASRTMLRAWFTLRGTRPHMMIREDIARLAVPTLFMWGESDSFVPPAIGREVAGTMPDASIDVISGVGHVPYLEKPDVIAAKMSAFLAAGS